MSLVICPTLVCLDTFQNQLGFVTSEIFSIRFKITEIGYSVLICRLGDIGSLLGLEGRLRYMPKSLNGPGPICDPFES